MSIERVSSNGLASSLLAQVMRANSALNTSQTQVASGKVADDYAGFGNKTSVMEAARAAEGRMVAYKASTQLALNQTDLQNTHLSSLSGLADQLRQAMTKSVADGDASTLMTEVQSIFDQAAQILNSKDSNGNYLYGGEHDSTPPFTPTSLADLVLSPTVADAFANGSQRKNILVGDGENVEIGVLASDIGSGLMQMLKDIAFFDTTPAGNFSGSTVISSAQSTFLSNSLPQIISAAGNLNTATASNGYAYNRLEDAFERQGSMETLYKGFVGDLESVDMGEAITRMNQNQVALQAALQVASQMNQISLLNFLR